MTPNRPNIPKGFKDPNKFAKRRPPRQPGLTPGVGSYQDSTYMDSINSAQQKFNQQQSSAVDSQEQNKISYGLDNTLNSATGKAYSANPYARASLLKAAYDTNVRSGQNQMGSRGQLYSGAMDRRVSNDASNFAGQFGALESEYAAAKKKVDMGLADAQSLRDSEMSQAEGEARGRAEKAALDPNLLPAGTRLLSPRRYQQMILKIRESQPKGKQRAQRIREIIKLRNQASNQLGG